MNYNKCLEFLNNIITDYCYNLEEDEGVDISIKEDLERLYVSLSNLQFDINKLINDEL